MRLLLLSLALLALLACGAPSVPTGQQTIDRLIAAGLPIENAHAEPLDAAVPVPRSYLERWVFTIPSVAPKGGQLFVCDTKKNCDALYAYYDALKALAGPYTYQSGSGLIVVQLNSGLAPGDAEMFEAALQDL